MTEQTTTPQTTEPTRKPWRTVLESEIYEEANAVRRAYVTRGYRAAGSGGAGAQHVKLKRRVGEGKTVYTVRVRD